MAILKSIKTWPSRFTAEPRVALKSDISAMFKVLTPHHSSKSSLSYQTHLLENESVLDGNGWVLGGPFTDQWVANDTYAIVYIAINRENGDTVIVCFPKNGEDTVFHVAKVSSEFAQGLCYIPF
jgi:hypothetical protein